MQDNRFIDLQEVVQRVLTDALGAQAEHLADIARRDELHLDETERRDELHMAEANRRDAAHLEEVNRRDEHYHDERARDVERHAREIDQLEIALENRDLIGQAKGVIMAAIGCTADVAYGLLRKQSQHENRKVTEIAQAIVSRATKAGQHAPKSY